MPRVSVVVPTYNPGDLLMRALSSVLSQTMSDLELIVVDDGSAEPPEWVRDVDSRVVYVRQANRGVSVARNVGVSRSRATWVAFLDQDDEWLPTKLERQLEHARLHPDAGFHCTGFTWVREGTEQPADPTPPTYAGLLSTQMVLLSSLLVRRADYEAVGGHSPFLLQMQDWDLFLRLSMEQREPAMVTEPLVHYHLHGANASADYWTAAQERFRILAEHQRRARRLGDDTALDAIERGLQRTRELYAFQAIDAARKGLRLRDRRAVLRHIVRAGRLDPTVVTASARAAAGTRVGALRSRDARRSRP